MADTDLPNGFGALNRPPRPIASPFGVVTTQERDIYQSSFGGGFNQYGGGVGGSTMAAGSVNFRFRCGQ